MIGAASAPPFDPRSQPRVSEWRGSLGLVTRHVTLTLRSPVRTSDVYDPIRDSSRDSEYRAEANFIHRADGALFVADAQAARLEANLAHLTRFAGSLARADRDARTFPLVVALNKQDLPNRCSTEDLRLAISTSNYEIRPTAARRGEGVLSALNRLAELIDQAELDS